MSANMVSHIICEISCSYSVHRQLQNILTRRAFFLSGSMAHSGVSKCVKSSCLGSAARRALGSQSSHPPTTQYMK